jgi:8-oxo-dGTP diphosphatase
VAVKLATLCYVRRDGHTLMLHRIKKANDMHAGKWNGLGGKLEAGETPEECAVREIYEESGLQVEHPHLRGMIVFPKFNGDDDWITYIFVVEQFTGTLNESNEGVLQWVRDGELFDLNLWPGDRIFLRWLDAPRFFSAKFVYQAGELTKYTAVFYTQIPGDLPEHIEQAVEGGLTQAGSAREGGGYVRYRPEDDTVCWMCGAPTVKRHCKIACPTCGFLRDCSDP